MAAAVEVDSVRKRYGDVVALDGVSFEVQAGEIFGVVGPNGAGKTTMIECIEGLRRPDSGRIRVLGLDPVANGFELRERIGVQLQASTLPDRIKVGEAIDLFAAFYRTSVDRRGLLARLGLGDKAGSHLSKLSGGQRQRVSIALALVNDPDVVFMDELTTGLDPQARRAMWDVVRAIRERGGTIFLTTHSMEEAERLCDRVAIVDHGRIVALDSVPGLIGMLGAEQRLVFGAAGGLDADVLDGIPEVVRVDRIGDRVVVHLRGLGVIGRVTSALEASGVVFEDLRAERPTLEDVFLALTGKQMRD